MCHKYGMQELHIHMDGRACPHSGRNLMLLAFVTREQHLFCWQVLCNQWVWVSRRQTTWPSCAGSL